MTLKELNQPKNYWKAAAAYVVIGFLVFGYHINHIECEVYRIGTDYVRIDCTYRNFESFLSGVFWPIYLVGALAIQVTK